MKSANKLWAAAFIVALFLIPITVQAFVVGGGPPSIEYIVDASNADQGVIGNGKTIKAYVDAIGASKNAVIKLNHTSTGNTTPYTLTTSDIIPSNIILEIENGAILDGAGTLTINGPFECGLYRAFGSSITVVFGSGAVKKVRLKWWGTDGAAIQSAIDSLPTNGGIIALVEETYTATAAINVDNQCTFEGVGIQASIIEINSGSEHLFNITSTGRIAFRNLTLQVESGISSRANDKALLYYNADGHDFIVENCLLNGVAVGSNKGTGIHIVKGVTYKISNCGFLDNAKQIRLQNTTDCDSGDGIIGPGNVFNLTTNIDGTFCIQHESGGGLKVIGNKFLGHRHQYHLDIADGCATGQLVIVGNLFDHEGFATCDGVTITRAAGTGAYNGHVITGNRFAIQSLRGILLNGSQEDGVISGNLFKSQTGIDGVGVQIEGSADWLIDGNTFISLTNGVYITNVAATSRILVGVNHYYNCTTNVGDPGSKKVLGFAGAAPVAIQDYTVTNKTPDRALDCDSTTTAELADVLGTLIDDLIALGVLK